MKQRLGLTLAFVLAFGSEGAAFGHDQWADGGKVPDWVKSSCCGPADAHEVPPEHVHEVECGGKVCYAVDGYPNLIPWNEALPSQDGHYWLFYSTYGNGVPPSQAWCFFAPMGT